MEMPRVEFGGVLVKCCRCGQEWHATAHNNWWNRLTEVTEKMIRYHAEHWEREHEIEQEELR